MYQWMKMTTPRDQIRTMICAFLQNPLVGDALRIQTKTDIDPSKFAQHPENVSREVVPNELTIVINTYNNQKFIKAEVPVGISFQGYGDLVPIHEANTMGYRHYDPYCVIGIEEKKLRVEELDTFLDRIMSNYTIVACQHTSIFKGSNKVCWF